jgi:uncharacterized membrane protein YgdD (TMEM256/DUF423 family)
MQNSKYTVIASISGGISVCVLALAAHFLPLYFNNQIVSSITTGAEIQLFHAILVITLSSDYFNIKNIKVPSLLLLAGSLIFSGSIYILGTNSIFDIAYVNFLGPITPIGGIMMISGWFLLAYNLYSKKEKSF